MDGNEFLSRDLDLESDSKRKHCPDCCRPQTVCWCVHLPVPRIQTRTKIILLQHPLEEKRSIRTARMLELGLAEGCCTVYQGHTFPGSCPALSSLLDSPHTLVLYPGPGSQDLDTLQGEDQGEGRNVIILDGTWDQARKIWNANPALHKVRRVSLSLQSPSEYVVRTQPMVGCLSTLETAAHTVARLEGRMEIVEPLLGPLRAMCNIQIHRGRGSGEAATFLQENREYVKRKPQYRDGGRRENLQIQTQPH